MGRVAKEQDAREAWGCLMGLLFSKEVHDRFHDATAAAGLPHPSALKLLLHVAEADAPSMRMLAELLRCDASWVTALVDVLEEAGHVERRVSPTDRRVKLVHATAAGQAALERAHATMAEPPPAMKRLSAAETKTLARLMRVVAEG